MGNNVRELRLAFLLTQKELAQRMGADVAEVERLESGGADLGVEWVEAVSRALGVPRAAVTDPSADISSIVARAGSLPVRKIRTCPIAARFAIQAMVAKLGGLKLALSLSEEDLARTVQNLVTYVESGEADTDEQRLNRLSLSLQIIVLTVLQSRGVAPAPGFQDAMEKARKGAMSLLQAFSEFDRDEADAGT